MQLEQEGIFYDDDPGVLQEPHGTYAPAAAVGVSEEDLAPAASLQQPDAFEHAARTEKDVYCADKEAADRADALATSRERAAADSGRFEALKALLEVRRGSRFCPRFHFAHAVSSSG